MTRDQRRLAAIVSVDVVGYSRLMGSDEPGTLARLKALRREVIDPKVAEYGGRIVNTAGDNQLLEFPSVVDAVRCSVDIQRRMAEGNADASADQRIDFRIGINVGDIIVAGDQIFGDGVNVAARVQALAAPGGICTSKVVRDQVLDKLNFSFEDLGAQAVKNIARPVEVYRVNLADALPAPVASAPTSPRLAVAVLPFTAPGGHSDEELLAADLTRDLTSALGSMMRMMQVVSRDLAASYKGKPLDPRSVGRELDASYLVEGELRRADNRIEIDAQLIETSSGTQVWNERLEIAQARGTRMGVLLSQVANCVLSGIKTAAMRRFAGPPAPNATPLELTWHGYSVWHRDRNTVQGALEARKWFDQALRLDPNLLPAVRGRCATLQSELQLDPKAEQSRILHEMDELSFRAVSIDSSDTASWGYRVEALTRQQRWEAALEANARAEKHASANVGWVLNARAEIMLLIGQPEEALALVDRQLALEPQNQEERGWAMLQRGRAYMALGRYDESIAACERDVALDNWWLPHLYLVAGYALRGEPAKAAAEKATLLELRPGTSIADFKRLYWSDNPAFLQQTEAHLLTGLRKAGFPEE